MKSIRNRIVDHVQVRAGDLLPHPLNFRRHSVAQRKALAGSYEEVGFARSLLGYRLADGRIQLIDGHLRRDLHPDMRVTVEVLDVTEEEARKLLLTLDPLAALAESDRDILAKLAEMTKAESQALNEFWQSLRDEQPKLPKTEEQPTNIPEQYLILVQCRDEEHQAELLARFDAEGTACKPLMS
ncbi:hypothetical protein AYO44_10455 [Planctomycetaceae bacterium SCGC AG-212-F19]|nr:hypothetical protein AYO44_10455 [Planctomycetaceae bacterium SCGC AG-212-F19]